MNSQRIFSLRQLYGTLVHVISFKIDKWNIKSFFCFCQLRCSGIFIYIRPRIRQLLNRETISLLSQIHSLLNLDEISLSIHQSVSICSFWFYSWHYFHLTIPIALWRANKSAGNYPTNIARKQPVKELLIRNKDWHGKFSSNLWRILQILRIEQRMVSIMFEKCRSSSLILFHLDLEE